MDDIDVHVGGTDDGIVGDVPMIQVMMVTMWMMDIVLMLSIDMLLMVLIMSFVAICGI